LLRLRPGNEAPDDRFLIVGVDEDSINWLQDNYEPSWGTLPDQALDDLLKILNQHQARLIGLDFFRDYAAKPDVATRIKQTQNLIAICSASSSDDPRFVGQRGVEPPPEVPIERVGFANLTDEGGQFARRQLLLQPPDLEFCNTLEAFSLVLARKYLDAEEKPYTSPLKEKESGEIDIEQMQFGNTVISRLATYNGSSYSTKDADDIQLIGYQTLINFRTPKGNAREFAEVVSLKKVLENQVSAELIRDRIVLIGSTALTSTETDLWNTPYGEMPGVILHGQMTSQLISRVLDSRPLIWWWTIGGESLWIFGWSLLGGVIVWRISQISHLTGATIASFILLYITCYSVLVYQSGWIPLVPPGIALVMTGIGVGYHTYRLRRP